jgi:hypothetical protein
MKDRGQATIEYLVILVAILGLAVIGVGLIQTITSDSGGVSLNLGEQINLENYDIGIKEAYFFKDGNGAIYFYNGFSSDSNIIVIEVNETKTETSKLIKKQTNELINFEIQNSCEVGITKKANVKIEYIENNLLKKINYGSINLKCSD